MWPFKRGGLSSGDELNKFMFVKWPFQRGLPLVRMASQKGFHYTLIITWSIEK